VPEALANTVGVASVAVCTQVGQARLPQYSVPDELTTAQFLRDESDRGLQRRLAAMPGQPDAANYDARLRSSSIHLPMGFEGTSSLWRLHPLGPREWRTVGPDAGSGAGSLVAYSLGITDLDPIDHDLLFERFLNPERVSMPDFDVDFCMDGVTV